MDSVRERVYDGIAQICLDGPHLSFADVTSYEPDSFNELIQPLLIECDHEIDIVK